VFGSLDERVCRKVGFRNSGSARRSKGGIQDDAQGRIGALGLRNGRRGCVNYGYFNGRGNGEQLVQERRVLKTVLEAEF
jgi:hypothetical protein